MLYEEGGQKQADGKLDDIFIGIHSHVCITSLFFSTVSPNTGIRAVNPGMLHHIALLTWGYVVTDHELGSTQMSLSGVTVCFRASTP
jgi:hypothetical protein